MSVKSDHYPIGATILFAGILPENGNWLLCDGRQFRVDEYPELFAAIKYTYSTDPENKSLFNVPDYLGKFLRGASHETTNDPDKNDRKKINPQLEVDSGAVGTDQKYATKRPSVDFQATFNHLPTSSKGTHGITKPDNTGYSGSESIEQSTCTSGGDKESRPINVYLNYYIKSSSVNKK